MALFHPLKLLRNRYLRKEMIPTAYYDDRVPFTQLVKVM